MPFTTTDFSNLDFECPARTFLQEGKNEIVLILHTGDFPYETSWELINTNTFEVLKTSSEVLKAYTSHLDTFLIDTSICLGFSILDSDCDGFDKEHQVVCFQEEMYP